MRVSSLGLVQIFSLFSGWAYLEMPTNGEEEGVAKIYLSAKICHTYFMIMNLGSVILEDPKNT